MGTERPRVRDPATAPNPRRAGANPRPQVFVSGVPRVDPSGNHGIASSYGERFRVTQDNAFIKPSNNRSFP